MAKINNLITMKEKNELPKRIISNCGNQDIKVFTDPKEMHKCMGGPSYLKEIVGKTLDYQNNNKVLMYTFNRIGLSFEFMPLVSLKGFEHLPADEKEIHDLMNKIKIRCKELKLDFSATLMNRLKP